MRQQDVVYFVFVSVVFFYCTFMQFFFLATAEVTKIKTYRGFSRSNVSIYY